MTELEMDPKKRLLDREICDLRDKIAGFSDRVDASPSTPPTPQERVERFQAAIQALQIEHGVKIAVKTYCVLPGGRIEANIPGVVAEAVLVLE